MRFVELRNTTSSRIIISQVRGFVVDAGQTITVHPATVSHPAVARYMKQRTLVEVSADAADVAPPPKAPSKPVEPKPKVVEKKEELEAPEPPAVVEEPGVEKEQKADEPAVAPSMKDLYLAAPGVTEENLESVMEKFPTPNHITMASKSELVDCGISRTFVSRLRSWAKENQAEPA